MFYFLFDSSKEIVRLVIHESKMISTKLMMNEFKFIDKQFM
jgi:hypothetical protein